MKIERLKSDLAKAREKAAEWQARVKDIERQITARVHLEIIQPLRGVTASPEALRDILDLIQSAKEPPKNNFIKEEPNPYEK